eukprot:596122-Hanusia_phi.AAC.1
MQTPVTCVPCGHSFCSDCIQVEEEETCAVRGQMLAGRGRRPARLLRVRGRRSCTASCQEVEISGCPAPADPQQRCSRGSLREACTQDARAGRAAGGAAEEIGGRSESIATRRKRLPAPSRSLLLLDRLPCIPALPASPSFRLPYN